MVKWNYLSVAVVAHMSVSLCIQQNIVVLSVPKSGTHLLCKAVELMTGKTACYDVANINWGKHYYPAHELRLIPKNKNITYVTIFRDPRDQFVSFIHALEKHGVRLTKNVDIDTVVHDILLDFHHGFEKHYGFSFGQNIKTFAQYYNLFVPFLSLPNSYNTRFELLVGTKGGGSDELQLQELRNIATHLNCILSEDQIHEMAKNLFGNTFTFVQGQIGSWKRFFSQENRILLKKSIGDVLYRLGYEKDDSWLLS